MAQRLEREGVHVLCVRPNAVRLVFVPFGFAGACECACAVVLVRANTTQQGGNRSPGPFIGCAFFLVSFPTTMNKFPSSYKLATQLGRSFSRVRCSAVCGEGRGVERRVRADIYHCSQ